MAKQYDDLDEAMKELNRLECGNYKLVLLGLVVGIVLTVLRLVLG